MNNIELLRQFILRKQDLLALIKPTCLILLLDECKTELIVAKKDYQDFSFFENNSIVFGEDIYQQNALDLTEEFYKSNIDDTEKKMDLLSSIIEILKSKLNFHNDYPISIEKTIYYKRIEIDWIFDLILTKRVDFQIDIFDILKNLIFGELIRINKRNDSIYFDLISEFNLRAEEWQQTWINIEIPKEEFF